MIWKFHPFGQANLQLELRSVMPDDYAFDHAAVQRAGKPGRVFFCILAKNRSRFVIVIHHELSLDAFTKHFVRTQSAQLIVTAGQAATLKQEHAVFVPAMRAKNLSCPYALI